MKRIINSVLDTDFYKITMGQAVAMQYGDIDVEYEFTDRGGRRFPKGFTEELGKQIQLLAGLRLTDKEYEWLKQNPMLGFMKRPYMDFLRGFQFDPDEVAATLVGDGELKIKIRGPWYRTIYWEVPLLALVSELYYKMTNQKADEHLFRAHLSEKATMLSNAMCSFADFGTRRRHSFAIHEEVVKKMALRCPRLFMGTSNVYLAMKYGLRVIGTHAHEWFSAHQAMFGPIMATRMALKAWLREFNGRLGTALTDTFTTDAFLRDFDPVFVRQFDGVRQDSGDPISFGWQMINHYKSLGIDPKSKLLIFSDGLDADRAIEINETFKEHCKVSFGIGTNLTNDVGVSPLNIVIKMSKCKVGDRWIDVVKLSDTPGKHHGTPEAIKLVKAQLGIN
ncbi:nicotinate phosphoribosyltransferase [Candidatus Falkowbacteria bacterium]|nr:nicotinate phosphoribosyltransferase [Candidatus Falkowbacteria bacterium]